MGRSTGSKMRSTLLRWMSTVNRSRLHSGTRLPKPKVRPLSLRCFFHEQETQLPSSFYYADTNLEQTWFSGAHTNVGGGYADQICADVALMWMIDRCWPYISFSPLYIRESVINLDHHPENVHSKPRSTLPGGK